MLRSSQEAIKGLNYEEKVNTKPVSVNKDWTMVWQLSLNNINLKLLIQALVLQWNPKRNSFILIQGNTFSTPECVKDILYIFYRHTERI